jgi:hypothetical protein
MPTPMTIEMENEMTKDEIEAALNKLEEPLWLNGGRSVPLIIRELLGVKHYETIRAALQSALDAQQSNADTVDLDALKEKMISDFEEEKESELGRGYELGLCHAVDYLAQNYSITRKTK